MSDFKTNEYANLIAGRVRAEGGKSMLVSRRLALLLPRYRDGFALECRAVRRLREDMGFRT